MSVSWDFLPCPISSANFRQRDFFRLLAIGMCHFLPVHNFGMAYLAGSKVKIQQKDPVNYWVWKRILGLVQGNKLVDCILNLCHMKKVREICVFAIMTSN